MPKYSVTIEIEIDEKSHKLHKQEFGFDDDESYIEQEVENWLIDSFDRIEYVSTEELK